MKNKVYAAVLVLVTTALVTTTSLFANERALNKERATEYNQLIVSRQHLDEECSKLREDLEDLQIEKAELERLVNAYSKDLEDIYSSSGYTINENGEAVTQDENSADSNTENSESTGYIFIGDSRYVGMNQSCKVADNKSKFMIAKVGEGYNYLVNTAIPKAQQIEQQHTEIKNWKYIICLGVNDLGNKDKYKEALTKLAETKNLYIESVNPVNGKSKIKNSDIEDFNNMLKGIENTNYIDSYTPLVTEGFNTTDGVHYNNKTQSKIFNILLSKINLG